MRRNVRFSPRMNWWFYTVFGVLFFSGLIWLVLHYFGGESTEFDGPLSSVKPQLLRIHGAAAFVSLVVLGALVPTHMQRAWAQERNRLTAFVMVALCILMVASGYGLYYCGSDILRSGISGFHSVTGILLPLALVWHVISGRKDKGRKHASS